MKSPPLKAFTLTRFANTSVLLYLLLGSACAFSPQSAPPEPPAYFQSDAELLFIKGEYEQALSEFQRIHEEASHTPEDRNQALYGLACTQIIMARTHRELADGIANLEKWDEEKGKTPFRENRRLLIFALKHQSDILDQRNQEQQQQDDRKDRLIANQKKEITKLVKTVERLQKQLEELEVIDEKFQEKRKIL